MPQDPLPIPPAPPKKNLYPDISQGSPVTLRALAALQRERPEFPQMVDIRDMDYQDPFSFSNVAAAVSPDEPDMIRVNPGLSMLYPENEVKRSLAHEGHHINQLKAGRGPAMAALQKQLPYDQRPFEHEADAYAQSLNIPRPPAEAWMPFHQHEDIIRRLFESSPWAVRRK